MTNGGPLLERAWARAEATSDEATQKTAAAEDATTPKRTPGIARGSDSAAPLPPPEGWKDPAALSDFMKEYAAHHTGVVGSTPRPDDVNDYGAMSAWHNALARSHGDTDLGAKHRKAAKDYATLAAKAPAAAKPGKAPLSWTAKNTMADADHGSYRIRSNRYAGTTEYIAGYHPKGGGPAGKYIGPNGDESGMVLPHATRAAAQAAIEKHHAGQSAKPATGPTIGLPAPPKAPPKAAPAAEPPKPATPPVRPPPPRTPPPAPPPVAPPAPAAPAGWSAVSGPPGEKNLVRKEAHGQYQITGKGDAHRVTYFPEGGGPGSHRNLGPGDGVSMASATKLADEHHARKVAATQPAPTAPATPAPPKAGGRGRSGGRQANEHGHFDDLKPGQELKLRGRHAHLGNGKVTVLPGGKFEFNGRTYDSPHKMLSDIHGSDKHNTTIRRYFGLGGEIARGEKAEKALSDLRDLMKGKHVLVNYGSEPATLRLQGDLAKAGAGGRGETDVILDADEASDLVDRLRRNS